MPGGQTVVLGPIGLTTKIWSFWGPCSIQMIQGPGLVGSPAALPPAIDGSSASLLVRMLSEGGFVGPAAPGRPWPSEHPDVVRCIESRGEDLLVAEGAGVVLVPSRPGNGTPSSCEVDRRCLAIAVLVEVERGGELRTGARATADGPVALGHPVGAIEGAREDLLDGRRSASRRPSRSRGPRAGRGNVARRRVEEAGRGHSSSHRSANVAQVPKLVARLVTASSRDRMGVRDDGHLQHFVRFLPWGR